MLYGRYVQLNKDFLRDDSLSWAEKGMIAYLVAKGFCETDIREISGDSANGVYSTQATLRKLIKKGYVERHPKRALGRIIGMAYTAFSSLEGRTKNGAAD